VYRGAGEQPASCCLSDHCLMVGGFWAGVAAGLMDGLVIGVTAGGVGIGLALAHKATTIRSCRPRSLDSATELGSRLALHV
jgi:hypothetical protein